LVHKRTQVALHSHINSHPIFTGGFQEVTGFATRDENDLWICRASDQPENKTGDKLPLHQRPGFQLGTIIAALSFAFVSMVFAMTGPLPSSALEALPVKLSQLFQILSAFLSRFGYWIAGALLLAVIYWKRELLLSLLRRIWEALVFVYVRGLAFLLRPAIRHIDVTQLQITRAKYGAPGKHHDVTRLLRRQILENKLELKVANDTLGGDKQATSPSRVVAAIIDGNLRAPSSYSR
jgi:hypothetical protein